LENWYDLLAFLTRLQLGQLASSIGNRRFPSIVQTFLHKYVRQITLRPINLSETTNVNKRSKVRVNLWKNDGWSNEEFPLADWPMPENITNFQSIQLRFVWNSHENGLMAHIFMTCDFLNQFWLAAKSRPSIFYAIFFILSYLDFSVLRFLQMFQENSLFTNVHLRITRNKFYEIVRMLPHLLPLISSIDSLALQSTDLINVINKEIGDESWLLIGNWKYL
jgi:hypothetical protein